MQGRGSLMWGVHGGYYERFAWTFGGFCLIALLWLLWMIVEAFYEVVKAPRVDMYNCEKHGLVPKHLCYVFEKPADSTDVLEGALRAQGMSDEAIKAWIANSNVSGSEPEYRCPFCYEDAFKIATETYQKEQKEPVRVQ